jgi:hypothetical protein
MNPKIVNKTILLLASTLMATATVSAIPKPKHTIANYNHVGMLVYHSTGNMSGPNVYHYSGDGSSTTCVVESDHDVSCNTDRIDLEVRLDDGHDYIFGPTEGSAYDDVLTPLMLFSKDPMAPERGVKFSYRIEGRVMYVPVGKTDKHGEFHVNGERAFSLCCGNGEVPGPGEP